jgi:hypothetical protein
MFINKPKLTKGKFKIRKGLPQLEAMLGCHLLKRSEENTCPR